MPRVVKAAADRRHELLDAALHLFAERGYAHTSVQAIIDAVGIAKGTFYHHFGSKSELLDALVTRMIDESVPLLADVADDDSLSGAHKLNAFFDRIDAWKSARRSLMLDLGEAITDDANAAVLEHLRTAGREAYAPVLARILAQGHAEGSFDVPNALPTAHIVLHVAQGLSTALAEQMRRGGPPDEVELLITSNHQALDRMLGARPGTVQLVRSDRLQPWIDAMKEGP